MVVSINYSLAPDHPFPKGLDDCIFAYAWCLENLHTLGECSHDNQYSVVMVTSIV